MRKIRITAVLVAACVTLGVGVAVGAGPASARPYRFESGQVVSVR